MVGTHPSSPYASRVMHRLRTDDRGSGLIMVVGSMMVLMTLSLTVLAFTMESQRFARYDQDYSSAMTAAQSGVEDYISRLNREDGYGLTADCTNPALKGPDVTGNSCGWTAATAVGWRRSTRRTPPTTRRTSTTRSTPASCLTEGLVELTVTGRANGVYRTIETSVGKGGSTDYVYYTDYESADPANVQAYDPADTQYWSTAQRNACGLNLASGVKPLYWWQGRDAYDNPYGASCVEITFIGGDELDGEVFTNDTILSTARTYNGVWTEPSFLKQVYTANAECKNAGSTDASWEDHCLRAGGVADFNGTKPRTPTPSTWTTPRRRSPAYPGCHYYGVDPDRVPQQRHDDRVEQEREQRRHAAGRDHRRRPSRRRRAARSPRWTRAPARRSTCRTKWCIYVDSGDRRVTRRQCSADEMGGRAGQTLPLGTYTATPAGHAERYDAVLHAWTRTWPRPPSSAPRATSTSRARSRAASRWRRAVDRGHRRPRAGGRDERPGHAGPGGARTRSRSSTRGSRPSARTKRQPVLQHEQLHVSLAVLPGPATSEASTWPRRYPDPTDGSDNPCLRRSRSPGRSRRCSTRSWCRSTTRARVHRACPELLVVKGSIAQRWRGIVGQTQRLLRDLRDGYTKDYDYDTPPAATRHRRTSRVG